MNLTKEAHMKRRSFFSALCGLFAAVGIGQQANADTVVFQHSMTTGVQSNSVYFARARVRTRGRMVVIPDGVQFYPGPMEQVTTVRRGLFGGTVVRTRIR